MRPKSKPMPFVEGLKTAGILSLMKQQIDYAGLSKEALVDRLSILLGTERKILVEFLRHLSEFDRREAYLEMGYGSLFDYCIKKLHLSKGSAYRRTIGSRLIRTYPQIADYLADGRICLSTLVVFKKSLNEENVDRILAQAVYKTKEEAEIIAVRYSAPVTLPRKESVRKVSSPKVVIVEVCKNAGEPQVPDRHLSSTALQDETPPAETKTIDLRPSTADESNSVPVDKITGHEGKDKSAIDGEKVICALVSSQKPDEIKAISEDLRVLKVTVSKEFIEELKHVRELLSHKFPDGSFEDVLLEGLKLIRQKYERSLARQDAKERGETMDQAQSGAHIDSGSTGPCIVASRSESVTRFPGKPDRADTNRYIPRLVQREVWRKSNGSCMYQGKNGTKCQSKWKLEFEHIIPVAKGGKSTADNIVLLCKRHNFLRARQEFGDKWMSQFSKAGQMNDQRKDDS